MLSVTIEIGEGAVTRRVRITAPCMEPALKMAGDGTPGRRVRLVFPMDPEAFFVPENPVRREAA